MSGVLAIWNREFIRFRRERSRIITTIFTPLLWIFVFGMGLGSAITLSTFKDINYVEFIFPGIVAMSMLFSSIFYGVSLIWDKQFGFLKEILVAPIPRISIFMGKVLGGCTVAILQGLIILLFSPLVGVHLSIPAILMSLVFMFFVALSIVSIGLILGSTMSSTEGFNLIMSFLVMPLFMLSGALFPLNNLPIWLKTVTYFDPLTYGVDGLRSAILGVSQFPMLVDIGVLVVFSLAVISIGSYRFNRMK